MWRHTRVFIFDLLGYPPPPQGILWVCLWWDSQIKDETPSSCTTSQLAHHSKQSLISFRSESWRRLSEPSPGHPEADVVMNVAAFSDVFENSLHVQVRPDLIIRVASLPGLMVLKLFAWLDRHEGRDAQDIRRLIETYPDAEMSTDSTKKRLMNWSGLASTLSWPELSSWENTRSA
jgi:hypothetical protein